MKNIWNRIKLLRAFATLIKDPRQTDKIFEISDAGRKRRRESAEIAMKAVLNDEGFLEVYRDGYNPEIELEKLRQLPQGTFGRAVAEFLDGNAFQPNTFPTTDSDTPLEYLVSRVRRVHDLWHVLSGYGTDVTGELALQGFTLAQLQSPFSGLLLAGGILHLVLYKPLELVGTFELIIEGYLRGKQARKLITVRMEENWNRSLADLRSELGIPALKATALEFSTGDQSWMTQARWQSGRAVQ